jgi:hypothetical protein
MRIKISDFLDFEVPDDPRLAEVDKHKKDILAMLRNEYERGAKSKPFDGDKASACLYRRDFARWASRRCPR